MIKLYVRESNRVFVMKGVSKLVDVEKP